MGQPRLARRRTIFLQAPGARWTCRHRKWSGDQARCTGVILVDRLDSREPPGTRRTTLVDGLRGGAAPNQHVVVMEQNSDAGSKCVESRTVGSIEPSSALIVRTQTPLVRPNRPKLAPRQPCAASGCHGFGRIRPQKRLLEVEFRAVGCFSRAPTEAHTETSAEGVVLLSMLSKVS